MRQKYGKDGVVTVSVSVDDAKDKEAVGRAEKFLEKVKANEVVNFVLNEEQEVWTERWKIVAPPAVFVFDRENRIALKLPEGDKEVSYEEVEKKIKELLKK